VVPRRVVALVATERARRRSTRTADGWSFAQVPELVPSGDQDTVIKN
jgi:hypothetical protein